MTPAELDAHLIANAVGDDKHDALLQYGSTRLSLFA
jgi:DNA sulfur modification protein DndC